MVVFFYNLNSHSVSKIKGRKLGSLKSIQEEGFIESDGFLDGRLRDRSACLGTLRTTVRAADIRMSSETVHFRMGWFLIFHGSMKQGMSHFNLPRKEER